LGVFRIDCKEIQISLEVGQFANEEK
jgi:hypothetical protein